VIEQRAADGAPATPAGDAVQPGSRVELRWDDGAVESFRLGTPPEFSPDPTRISSRSQLGHALLGARAGDVAVLRRHGGPRRAQVLAVGRLSA
jgi:transcription elongation GreA/GreB family factor